MGTARNGRVSKTFDDGKHKVKARFKNERQARRVAVLFEYVRVTFIDGATPETIKDYLIEDIDKCLEILGKIEAGHEQ